MKDLVTSLISSSVSAVLALTVVHPIDIYKNSIQLSEKRNKLIQYRGFSSSLCRELTYTTLRIGLYYPFKRIFNVGDKILDNFFVGSFTGIIATIVSNPFDICKIRAMSNTYYTEPKSVIFIMKDIIKTTGVLSLYRGIYINSIRASISNGVKFSTYDYNKKLMNSEILGACLTGVYLSLVITPFDYIRTQIMISNNKIIHIDITKIYSGFTMIMLRFTPSSIIQMILYEKLINY